MGGGSPNTGRADGGECLVLSQLGEVQVGDPRADERLLRRLPNVRHATWSMQHATCSTQHGTSESGSAFSFACKYVCSASRSPALMNIRVT